VWEAKINKEDATRSHVGNEMTVNRAVSFNGKEKGKGYVDERGKGDV